MKKNLIGLLVFALFPASVIFAQERSATISIENVGIAGTMLPHIAKQLLYDSLNFSNNDTSIAGEDSSSYTIEDENEIEEADEIIGDTTIAENAVIKSSIIVKNGTLKVAGTIKGNATVIDGDLVVLSTGTIEGDAHVVNGKIQKEPGGKIQGFEDIRTQNISKRLAQRWLFHPNHTFDVPWTEEITDFDQFIFRYNRVESVFLGLGSDKKYYWDGHRWWNAYGFVGWGFKSHKWRGTLGLSRQFHFRSENRDGIFDIGLEGYSLTDTKDRWIISQIENTLSSLFLHEDFRDYFQREGFTVYAGHYLYSDRFKSEIKLSYASDDYESMENRVDWAFFGGKKSFRENPAIDAGRIHSFILSGGLTTVKKTSKGRDGWQLYASGEIARKALGSEFGFNHYMLDVSTFQPFDYYENINARLRIGTADGNVPQQKIFELGGLGSLNAFPFKSYAGNRMLLLNLEFILSGEILGDLDFFPSWLFDHVILIAISDAGWIKDAPTSATPIEGFGDFVFKDVKHDFGIALGNRSGSYRLGIAWRTDCAAPAQLILRVQRPF
jgi:hypothetical protein